MDLKRVGVVFWLIIFSLSLVWRAQNLDAFSLSNDEGAHVMWARLAVDGYPLYSETEAVQAPLFLETVGLAFRLAGQTVQTGRWVILIGYGLLALALSWVACRAGGWPAALIALVLLGISPLTFTFSRLVMAEVPATALAVSSLALFLVYWDKGQKRWLVTSGLVLGLSFLTKALNPFLVAPLGLLLWLRPPYAGRAGSAPALGRRAWLAWLEAGLYWGGAVLIPLAVTLLIYKPAALYDQLVLFRSDLRAAAPTAPAERWAYFAAFSSSHWGFWLLAFGDIIAAVLWAYETRAGTGRRSAGGLKLYLAPPLLYPLVWTTWLVAGVMMLWWHAPLFPHHFIVLLPPLILLGAGWVAALIAHGPRLYPTDWSNEHRLAVLGLRLALLIPVAAVFNLPAMIEDNQQTAAIVTGGREVQALDLLKTVSNPDDFVMGDSQLLIFMADRRTPPPLGDVALVAIKAGRQTSDRMIKLTQAYHAPAVVQWSLRLPWLPDYLAWVQAHYLAKREWDNDHIIYFGPRFEPGQVIPNERTVWLGDSLALRGYQIEPESIEPGRDLWLKVYWQTAAPLDHNYTIFTQLLDGSGALVTGWDSQPLGGYFPTSRWPANEIITDMVRLPLPAGLPKGDYTLVTGVYLLETMERLPAAGGAGDHVILTTITIE